MTEIQASVHEIQQNISSMVVSKIIALQDDQAISGRNSLTNTRGDQDSKYL